MATVLFVPGLPPKAYYMRPCTGGQKEKEKKKEREFLININTPREFKGT